MNSLLVGLDVLTAVLRPALFVVGAVMAAVAGVSYAVRTRRINPFNPVARFVRGRVDPMFAPVERRVVRSGGQPATAPWWTLGVVIVGGIVLISLLGFVREQIAMAVYATNVGPRGVVRVLVAWTFGVLQIALMVRVFSSWFRTSQHSPWIRWAFSLTNWLVNPLRQIIPPLGMIDVTPIVAYFALVLLQGFVSSLI